MILQIGVRRKVGLRPEPWEKETKAPWCPGEVASRARGRAEVCRVGPCQGPGGRCCQKGRPERRLLHGDPGELPQHCSSGNEQVKGLCRLGLQLEDTTKELK